MSEGRGTRTIHVVQSRQHRIERRVRPEEREFQRLHLRLLNPYGAVVLKRENDRVAQAEPQLSVNHEALQVRRFTQFVGANLPREQIAVSLALLRPGRQQEKQ